MSINVEIKPVPNQNFIFLYKGDVWELTFRHCTNVMAASIVVNGETLCLNQRIVADSLILPYVRFWKKGNFYLKTRDSQLPKWNLFGTEQLLYFIEPEELNG